MLETPAVTEEQPENDQSRVGLVFMIGALSAFGPLCLDMYLPGLPCSLKTWAGYLGSPIDPDCLSVGSGRRADCGWAVERCFGTQKAVVGWACHLYSSLVPVRPRSVCVILIGLRLLQGAAGAAGIVIARAMVRDLYAGAKAARFFALTLAVNGVVPNSSPGYRWTVAQFYFVARGVCGT